MVPRFGLTKQGSGAGSTARWPRAVRRGGEKTGKSRRVRVPGEDSL